MKNKLKIIMSIFVISTLIFTYGCGNSESIAKEEDELMKNQDGYYNITQSYAKEIMDSEEKVTILDVRTKDEFDEGHIKGAILIPHDEIDESISDIISEKDKKILVYCRSGNRSKVASKTLSELGYSNVMEFGGINTWPYEIVKD